MNTARYAGLDGLRGILALSVVGIHLLYFCGIHNTLTHETGNWAVIGFVTLSGFVITKLLLIKKEPYDVFIFRRFMRLFPAFAICLAFSITARAIVGRNPMPGMFEYEQEHFARSLAEHLTLFHGASLNAYPLGEFAFLPPAWSISLEWQLYLLAPLCLALMLRGSWLVSVLLINSGAIALCHLMGKMPAVADGLIWTRAFFFLVGMTLAIYGGRIPRIINPAGMIAAIVEWHLPPWPKALLRLGEVSYSVYLVHWPLLTLIDATVPREWSTLARLACLTGIGVPLTIFCSIGLYEIIEKPCIKLTKSIRWTSFSRDEKELA